MGGNSPLFVGVYKTSNGIPNDSSDNLLGQVQIDANDLPTSDSWVKINFSTQNILLDSTEIYALIFSRPQYDGKSIYWKGTTTNQYEGNFYSKVQYMGNTWKEPNGISNEHIDMGLGMTVTSNLNTPITSLNIPQQPTLLTYPQPFRNHPAASKSTKASFTPPPLSIMARVRQIMSR